MIAKWKSRGGVAILAVPIVIALGGTAAATAPWKTTGTGSGASKSTSITAPTSITLPPGTVTNATVAVSWSGATVPSAATALYFVERKLSSTYSAACGSTLAAPISGTSCSDTSVPDGTYNYRVTTRIGTKWQAVSTDSASTVTATLTPPQAPTGVSATIQSGSKFTPSWTAPSGGTTPTGYECQERSPQGTAVNNGAASGGSGTINTWFTCTSGGQVNTTGGTYTLYVRGVAGSGGATKGTASAGVNIAP